MMSRHMYNDYYPGVSYIRRYFKYEVITPLTPENTKKITDILNSDNISIVKGIGIMGTTYYGIKDSNGKMLCFGEFEEFDLPRESYRICLGDYRANANKPIEIANLNCWYKDVLECEKFKTVRKKAPEKQILETYNRIRLYQIRQNR